MRILEFLFFMIVLGRASSGASDDLYNKVEFEHLCKILKVAEGEPPQIPDELGKFLETRKILEKLLRATQTSTATYQKVLSLKHGDKEDAEFISYTVKRRIANEKIRHAMEKVKDIYHRMEEELIQAKKERTLARNNLVHAIYGVQVGEIPKEEDIALVLKNVSKASVFNRWGGNENVDVHQQPPTEPTCGATTGEGAGFTLINDFYCLCVGKDSNHTACHEDIRGPGVWKNNSVDWHAEEKITCECKDCDSACNCCGGQCTKEGNKCVFYCDKGKCDGCKKCKDNCCCCCCKGCDAGCNCAENCKDGCCRAAPYGVLQGTWTHLNVTVSGKNQTLDLPEGWPHIRKACQKVFKEPIPTTAESIQEVLDGFNKLLGANSSKKGITTSGSDAENESRRMVVLGYVKNMDKEYNSCTGAHKHTQKGDMALCVDYWTVLNNRHGIVWEKFMVQAQRHLHAMDQHVQKAQQLSTMIRKLKESAEESYSKVTHGNEAWEDGYGFREHPFFNLLIFWVGWF